MIYQIFIYYSVTVCANVRSLPRLGLMHTTPLKHRSEFERGIVS